MDPHTPDLIAAVSPLFRTRDMGENHYAQLISHLESFCAYAGRTMTSLSDESVNRWLSEVVCQRSVTPKTKRAYRASVLNAWNTLYKARLIESGPGLVQPISSPRVPPRAWKTSELRRLLLACQSERYGDWAACLIEVTWSTGLRRCDAVLMNRRDIDDGGVYRLIQKKTGLPHAVHVSDAALLSLDRVGGQLEDLTRGHVSRIFRRLRKSAGIKDGTARWLRRSASSYVERETGMGKAFLGHAGYTVADKCYFDPEITSSVIRGPSISLSSGESITPPTTR